MRTFEENVSCIVEEQEKEDLGAVTCANKLFAEGTGSSKHYRHSSLCEIEITLFPASSAINK